MFVLLVRARENPKVHRKSSGVTIQHSLSWILGNHPVFSLCCWSICLYIISLRMCTLYFTISVQYSRMYYNEESRMYSTYDFIYPLNRFLSFDWLRMGHMLLVILFHCTDRSSIALTGKSNVYIQHFVSSIL